MFTVPTQSLLVLAEDPAASRVRRAVPNINHTSP